MSEPKGKAKAVEPVIPGVYRWHVPDDRIGGVESDAYAVVREGRVTLIDPLPIDDGKLQALGKVEAIVLTAGNHQRSAWRLRDALGTKVYAPENAYGLEQQPDYTYSGGDLLPGGLTAFHTPGPVESMHALWLDGSSSVVFLSDLLTHEAGGDVTFVPGEYQDEPKRTRASIERIVEDLPVECLCFAHGRPITKGGQQILRDALTNDHEKL